MQKWHSYLGYGGLIPFIGLSLLALSGGTLFNEPARFYLIPYGALIFSFIGGIYWGVTLSNTNKTILLLVSITVMLWAWLWIILPGIPPSLMALSFWLLPLFEFFYLRQVFNSEFLLMRRVLSIIAGISLATLCFV